MEDNIVERAKRKELPKTAVRLKTLRAEYGMTQAEVARRLGISQQTYSKYENTDASIDSEVLRKLCALYGVSADYLLAIESRPAQPGVSEQKLSVGEDQIDLIVSKVLSKIDDTKK